jgi:preprotein translocase subunit YajC
MFKVGHDVMTPGGKGTVVETVGTKAVVVRLASTLNDFTFKSSVCRALPTADGAWVPAAKYAVAVGTEVLTMAGQLGTVTEMTGSAWAKVATKRAGWHQVYSLRVRAFTGAAAPTVGFDACKPVVNDAAWKSHWAAWNAKLQPTHTKAISNYTGSWYVELNRALRDGVKAEQIKYCDRLDAALAMGTLDRPAVMWRSGSSKFDKSTPVGMEFTDAGFGSCSIDEGTAFGWGNSGKVLFEIRALPGTRGAYVETVSYHKHEKEFVLPRNTRYRVAAIRTESLRTVLTVDVVGQD